MINARNTAPKEHTVKTALNAATVGMAQSATQRRVNASANQDGLASNASAHVKSTRTVLAVN